MGARTVIRMATLVALALLVGQMPAYAQHGLTGSLGADLSALDFSNKLPTLSEAYAVNRALSDQYLQLNFRGPLYHPRVGTYSVLGKLAGSYYKVDSTTGDAAEYFLGCIESGEDPQGLCNPDLSRNAQASFPPIVSLCVCTI